MQMITVTSLNTQIKSLLEATFMHILVEGEVASVTYHSSGHLYFSIKDKESSIKCVMWRSSVSKMKFRIEQGMHIVVEGSLGVYTPRGEYQFYAVKIEPYGQGALALAFEQLKEKLKAQGYFAQESKKNIPKHIKKLALVTAKDSAALHDMLKIIDKRWPLLEVVIVDTLVQGSSAGEQIAKSLKYADRLSADVVIVGRGGGSLEDLWAFNEEVVADAIFNLKTPVVSAVGHEVDVLISDFVADLRAPTPSAAIEMILPDKQEILYTLAETQERFRYAFNHLLQKKTQEITHIEELLLKSSPIKKLEMSQREFENLKGEFGRLLHHHLQNFENQPKQLRDRYLNQINFILNKKEQELAYIVQKIEQANPALSYKKSWAQVSKNGNLIELSSINLGEKFTLQDAKVKLEVEALDKSMHE